MDLMLLRIDGCPLQDDPLSFALKSWLAVLADTINSDLEAIEGRINSLIAPSHTSAEIVAAGPDAPDGQIWYDTDNNEFVGKANGALVKFTVTPYP